MLIKENNDLDPRTLELLGTIDRNSKQYVSLLMYSLLGFLIFSLVIVTILGIIDVIFHSQFLMFDQKFIEHIVIPIFFIGSSIFLIPIFISRVLLQSLFKNLDSILESLYSTEEKIENFEEITHQTLRILKIYKKILALKKILPLMVHRSGLYEIIYYIQYDLDKLIPKLKNLRSDLSYRIEEQVSSLRGAHDTIRELENTLDKNRAPMHYGINNITELQSARLDRQIEQFEELQRVLVKM